MGRHVAVLVVGLEIGLPAGVRSEPAPTPAVVTIRATPPADMPAADSRTAWETVRATFEESGIEIVWRDCASRDARHASPPDSCDPLSRTEVVLRFAPAPANAPRDSLGFSYVVKGAGIGRLATVYPDRVRRLAEWASVDASVLLGRVIAHEVGHLLLGTTDHSPDGVMRARWSKLHLTRQRSMRAWGFSLEESAAMRRSLLAGGEGLAP